jgi:hypothetical protein
LNKLCCTVLITFPTSCWKWKVIVKKSTKMIARQFYKVGIRSKYLDRIAFANNAVGGCMASFYHSVPASSSHHQQKKERTTTSNDRKFHSLNTNTKYHLCFLRHGQSTWNRDNRFIGWTGKLHYPIQVHCFINYSFICLFSFINPTLLYLVS